MYISPIKKWGHFPFSSIDHLSFLGGTTCVCSPFLISKMPSKLSIIPPENRWKHRVTSGSVTTYLGARNRCFCASRGGRGCWQNQNSQNVACCNLVGGFNAFEKYWSNWIISPTRGKMFVSKLKPPASNSTTFNMGCQKKDGWDIFANRNLPQ